ncbi:MAG: thiamine-phosphate kinase [Magnetococcales bacterium]|nr:thiamine-phosphate kinase [Magnetococcales bacterium]
MDKKDPTIASLGEFGLIQSHFAPLCSNKKGITVGIGDDGAVLAVQPNQELVVSTDTLVEHIHFSSNDNPYQLAKKSLRVNLSDLAAMGANPNWYLLNIATPPSTQIEWINEFARGLKEDGERYSIVLTGGDTTSSKSGLVITITVMGTVDKGRAILRSGAKPGDKIFLSGTLGDSTLGLTYRLGYLKISNHLDAEFLQNRHLIPEPRVSLGLAILTEKIAHSAIDISDGLIADLKHVCSESNVGAEVDVDKIPLSGAATRLLETGGKEILTQILTGGEDYELLFTADAAMVDKIASIADKVGVGVTEIGVVSSGSEVKVLQNGSQLKLDSGGWTHF